MDAFDSSAGLRIIRPLRNIMRVECEAALVELGHGLQQSNAGAPLPPATSIGDLMKGFISLLQVAVFLCCVCAAAHSHQLIASKLRVTPHRMINAQQHPPCVAPQKNLPLVRAGSPLLHPPLNTLQALPPLPPLPPLSSTRRARCAACRSYFPSIFGIQMPLDPPRIKMRRCATAAR